MIIYWFLIILLWDHWLCRLKCCLLLIVQSLLLVAQPHISTVLVVVGSTHSTHFACFFDVFFWLYACSVVLAIPVVGVYSTRHFFCSTLIRNHWLFLASPVLKKMVISMIFPSMFVGEMRIFSDLFLVTFQHCVSSCPKFAGYIMLHPIWMSFSKIVDWFCWLVDFFLVICHNIAHQTRTPLTYQPTEVLETAQLTYVEVSIL